MNPGGIRCLCADDPADAPRAGAQAAAENARPSAGRSSRKLALTLKAGYVFGADFRTMYVRLAEAENGIGDAVSSPYLNFTLKSEEGTTCKYALKADNAIDPFASRATIHFAQAATATDYHDFNLISATSTEDNSADKTCTLTYTVPTLPIAGTYTDTLTFSIVTEE